MKSETTFFLDKLLRTAEPDMFSAPDLLLAMCVAALLAYVLAHVYRHTHRGTSYSQSFLVTLFIMSVATAVVMLIIGSNIARKVGRQRVSPHPTFFLSVVKHNS